MVFFKTKEQKEKEKKAFDEALEQEEAQARGREIERKTDESIRAVDLARQRAIEKVRSKERFKAKLREAPKVFAEKVSRGTKRFGKLVLKGSKIAGKKIGQGTVVAGRKVFEFGVSQAKISQRRVKKGKTPKLIEQSSNQIGNFLGNGSSNNMFGRNVSNNSKMMLGGFGKPKKSKKGKRKKDIFDLI